MLVVPDVLERAPDAPVATIAEALFEALRAGPVRATAAGYLPRALCAAVFERLGERHGGLWMDERTTTPGSEVRFRSLHTVRVVAEYAGLIRLRAGRFALTERGRRLFERHGSAGLYPALLRAHASELDWSSLDDAPSFDLLQAGVGFTLLLLVRFGASERTTDEYAERWLRAFPRAFTEVHDDDGGDAADDGEAVAVAGDDADAAEVFDAGAAGAVTAGLRRRLARAFEARVVDRFLEPFGLVHVRRERGAAGGGRPSAVWLRSTPLLREVVVLRHGI